MKKRIPWGEFIFLAVILAYVAYYFFSVRGYSHRAVLWPFCLMGAMLAAVAAVGVEIVKKAPTAEGTQSVEKPALRQLLLKNASVFVIIAAFVSYALLLKILGLHLCNFLISFVLVFYLNRGRWRPALITACIITLSFYLVFDLAMGIRLPACRLF
ncbi:MAG: hypothetical protein HFF60_07170 [Oscillospiraceae bacterium]|jgi:hypothetical protein|nr:hypothetical protein [Oscillospiraceae bacterium]